MIVAFRLLEATVSDPTVASPTQERLSICEINPVLPAATAPCVMEWPMIPSPPTPDQLVSCALIDSLAAELIATGVVRGRDLAERIERCAEGHEPPGRHILKAFARSLRGQPGTMLTVIDGGLSGPRALPAGFAQNRHMPCTAGCDPDPEPETPSATLG